MKIKDHYANIYDKYSDKPEVLLVSASMHFIDIDDVFDVLIRLGKCFAAPQFYRYSPINLVSYCVYLCLIVYVCV